jgi:hypothetical protein
VLLIYKIIILKWLQARCDTNTFSWEKLDMREQVIVTFIEEKPQMYRKKYGLEPAATYCLIKISN